MKTLKQLAEKIQELEKELAYGSETSNLTAFVAKYDCISSILEDESDRMITNDEYSEWIEAYKNM